MGTQFIPSEFRIIPEKQGSTPLGEFSHYKTLAGTSAVAGIPILGIIFAVPYMFNAWLTDIQKKAGKIGIMKAMEKIDDPRIFADLKDAQPTENK